MRALYSISIAFLLLFQAAAQQNDPIIDQALEYMKYGETDGAIQILEKACKKNSKNIKYAYYLSSAYHSLDQNEKVQRCLAPLMQDEHVSIEMVALLAWAYRKSNDSESAIDLLQGFLVRFPKSSKLVHELGLAYMAVNKDRSLEYFRTGMKLDPQDAANYLWSSKIYQSVNDIARAIYHAELYLNLEKDPLRSVAMSQRLYQLYKQSISLSFGIDLGTPQKQDGFAEQYRNMLSASIHILDVQIGIEELITLRKGFIDNWTVYVKGQEPDPLFVWHRKLIDAQQFEAYNHWLFSTGDETTFLKYYTNNRAQFNSFKAWKKDNVLSLDNWDHSTAFVYH